MNNTILFGDSTVASAYFFYLYGATTYFKDSNGNADIIVNNPKVYNDGSWHFCCAVFNGSSSKLYVDNLSTAFVESGQNNVNIIGGMNTTTYRTIAYIDKIHLYNRALTDQEISNIYNGEKGAFGL